MDTGSEDLVALLLFGLLGLALLFLVIYAAVLAAIRESRRPPKTKKAPTDD